MIDMRSIIDLIDDKNKFYESLPIRSHNSNVYKWLEKCLSKKDIKELYLHGSMFDFNKFNQPNTDNGSLIFSSKLSDKPTKYYQAEYYGSNLYLIKNHYKQIFDPLNDRLAKSIMAETLKDVWDYENKIRYGRIDYQDCHLIIPPAVSEGYDFFKIYEISIQSYSYGNAKSDTIEIIDKFTTD